MKFLKRSIFILGIFLSQASVAQEGIAVYSDYLSDNYYLIHPSMAGAANCGKVRLTARQQWFGQDDAPRLQTLSFNTSVGDSNTSGVGAIAFNDKNGYHSQVGAKVTYAHHIRFGGDLNMLSFGLSAGAVQSVLDESRFNITEYPDPTVNGTVRDKYTYFNVDLGMSYHFNDFYAHVTVKNAIANKRQIYSDVESDNLRKFLGSAGYTFGNSDGIQIEPSVMFQYTQETTEKALDANLKVYKPIEDFGKIWGGYLV